MTDPTDYSAEQALSRDLLIHALNGGASVYCAHVHGVSADRPPEQVRAEGIHLSHRSAWSVDLNNVTRAVTKLIKHPEDCAPAVLAAATEHSEPRALIDDGMDENAALAQAADDSILVARSTAQLARRASALVELVDAYDGSTYRLLRDLGDHLGLSLAYVDRDTVQAHVERTLSETEWGAVTGQLSALDLDDHVGDFGTFRTDWIETVLDKAGVPGYGYTADARPVEAQPATVEHDTGFGGCDVCGQIDSEPAR